MNLWGSMNNMKNLKSLKDLKINQDLFDSRELLNQNDFFDTFFVKGVSKDTLGFEYDLSKSPKYNRKRNFFNELSSEIKIEIKFISSDDELVSIKKDVIYLPSQITIINFYKSLRNSIAHHNYFVYDSSILFFSSFAGKGNDACLAKSWKTRSNFYCLLSDADLILKIAKFLYKYFELK